MGAFHEKILQEINVQDLSIAHNDFWPDGMTSSIICGLKKAINLSPEIDAAIILICDQPFLSSSVLLEMIEVYISTGKEIIQCKYADNYGPPILFDQSLFASIMDLTDKNGARSIIRQHPDKVAFVSFPDGCIDIDTDTDFEKLNHRRMCD
jgi:molybdenum cofactor cytidylyltransferase